MDSIQNVNNVNFKAVAQEQKQAETTTPSATTNPIENGDEKSMDALKWAGIIGAATLAAGAITYGAIRGKGIDAKYVQFDKAGKATLNADGQKELGKITKWIKGIDDKGNIKKTAKIVDEGKNLVTRINKDGQRISQKVTKDGKSIVLEYDADNKLIKSTKDKVTTTYKYGKEGAAKGKLIEKKVGDTTYTYSYNPDGKIKDVKSGDKTLKEYTWTTIGQGNDQKVGLTEIKTENGSQEIRYTNDSNPSNIIFKDKDGKITQETSRKYNNNEMTDFTTKTTKEDGKEIVTTGIKQGDDKFYVTKSEGETTEIKFDGKTATMTKTEDGKIKIKLGDKTEIVKEDYQGAIQDEKFRKYFGMSEEQIQRIISAR